MPIHNKSNKGARSISITTQTATDDSKLLLITSILLCHRCEAHSRVMYQCTYRDYPLCLKMMPRFTFGTNIIGHNQNSFPKKKKQNTFPQHNCSYEKDILPLFFFNAPLSSYGCFFLITLFPFMVNFLPNLPSYPLLTYPSNI